MRALSKYKAALRLAILAIALHALLLGSGGVACLEALPLPWLQVACADACCGTIDDCCPGETVLVPSPPSDPATPTCCITAATCDWLPSQRSAPRLDPGRVPAYGGSGSGLSPAPRGLRVVDASPMRRPPPTMWVGVILLQI